MATRKSFETIQKTLIFIGDRLREDRRTPLHFWRSQMCRELLRIMAASARILEDLWRVLLQSWPQNAAAFASFNAEEFTKKTCQNGSESTKIHQNGPKWRPSKKISPEDRKRAEKEANVNKLLDPPGHPKSVKIERKGVSKIDAFFDPLLETTLPHFSLPQATQKQPK